MKKTLIRASLAVTAVGAAIAAYAGSSDPVVMTVNGKDVPLSEFEYLYHKNSQQQVTPQPLDEYVEMFKIYKLKVADALAEGVDTTASFRKEFNQYRAELAAPYLTDSTYIYMLADEAYNRGREEAEAWHIMRFKQPNAAANAQAKALLDSLRHEIVDNGTDFSLLAREYSQDRNVVSNGGRIGYITSARYPYAFETAVYTLGDGEVSEVVESGSAYHLIMGGKRRPNRGTVQAAHIMKMVPRDATPQQKQQAKATIDSIYNVIKEHPGQFATLAMQLSDDKNSGRQGGLLPWFGAGEMVEAFDSVAFALDNGEISEPFLSPYGWHIVRKLQSRPYPTLEEARPMLVQKVTNPKDERSKFIKSHQTQALAKKRNGRDNSPMLVIMKEDINRIALDTAFYKKYTMPENASQALYLVGNDKYTVGEFMSSLNGVKSNDPTLSMQLFNNYYDNFVYNSLMDYEQKQLENEQPDYRNLLNEFRDGSLLYEVSVNKVWDKASKDAEGLEKFFNEHRGDYTWTEPHVKGWLVQAVNDSVAEVVRKRMAEVPQDSILLKLRREFRGQAQIDKILATKGQIPMVDCVVFGGPEVKPANANYNTYFLYNYRVLDNPEEFTDVRGMVTSDFQNQLEQEWIAELKEKYPVKVNSKVLKKVK